MYEITPNISIHPYMLSLLSLASVFLCRGHIMFVRCTVSMPTGRQD